MPIPGCRLITLLGRRLLGPICAVMLLINQVPLAFAAQPATPAASACLTEREPNDQPGQEQDLGHGAVCVDAQKPVASQDLYTWTVSAAEARQRWSIGLSGVAGQVTKLEVYHVEKDAAGTVTKADKLLAATSDESQASAFDDLLFSAGTYTIAIAASGPGPYRLTIKEGTSVSSVMEREPNDDPTTAQKVAGAFAVSGDRTASPDAFAWTLSAADAAKRWTMRLQGPVATTPDLRMTRADGTEIARLTAGTDGVVNMPDIGLPAETYLLTVGQSSDPTAPYLLVATPQPSLGPSDLEPNDTPQTATPLTLTGDSTAIRGRLATVFAGNDVDAYALTVDDRVAHRQIYVKLFWRGGHERQMCLLDNGGNELECQTATTGIAFNALVLPKGAYIIAIKGADAPDDPYLLRIDVTREAVQTYEAEPNNSLKAANPIAQSAGGFTMNGRLTASDQDYFKVTVTGAPQLWLLEADGPGVGQLDLVDITNTIQMTSRASSGTTHIYDAFLLPGDHWLRVSGDSGAYTLRATPLGPPDPEAEHEPNNDLDHSQPIRLLETRTGRLVTNEDVDLYRFALQNSGYIRLELVPPADGLFTAELNWQAISVRRLTGTRPGAPIVYDLWLNAGDYSLNLAATTPSAKPYRLRISPLDPFATPADLEPNDDASTARPLPAILAVQGTLDPQVVGGDQDYYLVPARPAETQATITASANVTVDLTTVGTASNPGTPVPLSAGTVAGSYLATLPANSPLVLHVSGQPGPYAVHIDLAGQAVTATPVAGSPPTPVASPLASPVASPQASPIAVAPQSPLTAALELDHTPVSAFWQDGQRLNGRMTICNAGVARIDATLDAATGVYAWSVSFGQASVAVAPGASVTVPVTVHVAPDAWADQPVLITVRARGSGAQATASALVTPAQDAVPLAPERVAPLPPALLGGLDVAWSGLGAKPVTPDQTTAADQASLYDQLAYTGLGWHASLTGTPIELTVQLAAKAPVAGIVLDPQASDNVAANQPRDFELQLSIDGQQFTTVLTGAMSVISAEQPFVLKTPVTARFARLRLLSTQDADSTIIALGEWKVIATPGWTLPAAKDQAGLDLSPPERGGHVVAMQPQFSDVTAYQLLTTADGVRQTLDVPPESAVSWIVGFHDGRAAQIASLAWVDPPGSDPKARFDQVQVEVAIDSPSGPWTPLGTWTLERSGGKPPVFALPKPEWARFIRFTGVSGKAQNASGSTVTWEFPDTIRMFEAPPDSTYRSALGEWGRGSRAAIYEALVTPAPITLDPDAGNSRPAATALPIGKTVTNSAAAGRDVDWYRVDIPPGDDLLRCTLRGFPTIEVAATLLDAGGKTVAVKTDGATATEARYSAPVRGGESYYLKIEEPPSSVVFAFDTSGSIGPFVSTVYQGLYRYAGEVKPGQEFVNILPFGSDLLLKQWTDQPYLLQSAITNYPETASSSDSEGSLLTSMDGLAGKSGAKAIVLITDGETSATPEELKKLWPQLDSVRPQVFSIQIAGQTAHAQDLMQDWAAVKDGQYVYAASQGQMDVAFARATTVLRRPTLYALTAEATTAPPTPTPSPTNTPVPTNTPIPTATLSPTPSPSPTPTPSPTPSLLLSVPPPPGAIQVEAPPETAPPLGVPQDVSVAIILDTSGSMLQGLEASTRIDVAKGALTNLVTQTIPAGTNVSLRTFGDTPDSCETRLVVPRGPLDPATMAQTINDIPVVDLVKTPIGDSLTQVAGDLGTDPGPKIVVLVTDGEETCGGDPAAAIQALVASGIDVRVNIVGFAVDDATLKAQFDQWARLGNGRYIDASSGDELQTAVKAAVQPGFDVVTANGTVVASGQVGGDPVAVPAGTYSVVVHADPGKRVDGVVVTADQTTKVQLDGATHGNSPPRARAGPVRGAEASTRPPGNRRSFRPWRNGMRLAQQA